MNKLAEAIEVAGSRNIGRQIDRSHVAVHHWKTKGLPPTEYMGATEYWKVIQRAAKGQGFKVTKKELFDASNELRNTNT